MAGYTGFYIQSGSILGPRASGRYQIIGNHIYGPGQTGRYWIAEGAIYGPGQRGQFYVQNSQIYGPTSTLPWLADYEFCDDDEAGEE